MYFYRAHGLGIRSALPLPGLIEGGGTADVLIRFEKLGLLLDGRRDEIRLHASATDMITKEAYLSWPGVGSARVTSGREILVEREAGAEEEKLLLFVLGHVMALLLQQRGSLALHANAVAVNGGGTVFLGASGAGKTTLTAGLHRRGYSVLADDLVTVGVSDAGCPTVYPGSACLKLLPDVLAFLGESPESLPKLYAGSEKRVRRVAPGARALTHRLACAFVLTEGVRPGVRRLRPCDAVVELLRHAYGTQHSGAATTARLRRCADVASRVPVYRLTRAPSLSTLPTLLTLVAEHLGSGGRTCEQL
jgi:hypothetical protein